MHTNFSVSLDKILNEFSLEVIYLPDSADKILISSADVNRPGLQLAGFFEFFDSSRLQILGKTEMEYLTRAEEDGKDALDAFIAQKPAGIMITRALEIPERMKSLCEEHRVPLMRTEDATSSFMSGLISFLNVELAPRVTRHGVLVEVYGEGLLILGESGVGKSETAIELVKRGHRLIADDAVEIRKVSGKTLVGTAPDNIRYYIELRGIGIVNVRRIFGMGAVKQTEKIDMVINMEPWNSEKVYDRMGVDGETVDILGLTVPSLTIPVKPGRNLAVIIEVAAMNNRQKKMGYNAALELLRNLGMDDGTFTDTPSPKDEWQRY